MEDSIKVKLVDSVVLVYYILADYLLVLSIIQRVVLKSLTKTVIVFSWSSIHFCVIYFEAVLLGT